VGARVLVPRPEPAGEADAMRKTVFWSVVLHR
jgi:hypothetical protein